MALKTNYKNIKKLGLCIIAFEAIEHLYNIISELRESVDYVVIGLQRVSYHGDPISEIDLLEIFRLRDEDKLVDNILEVNLDINKLARELETDKRNLLIQDALDHGCTHAIVIDSDEYYTRKSFEDACKQIDDNDYEITYCQYVNYYHDYKHFLVYPFKEGMYVPFVTKVQYRHHFDCTDFTLPSDPTRRYVRPYSGVQKVRGRDGKIHEIKQYTVDYHVFKWNEVKMHHLSWLRADIRKKLNVWSSKKCFNNFNDLIDRAVESFENFDEDSILATALMLFNTPGNSVDVKAFPKQYIHPKVDFKTRLRKVLNPKKFVVLSMCADTPLYNKLEDLSNKTWRNYDKTKYPDINVEFWTYTDTDNPVIYTDVENHIIYIPKPKIKNQYYATFSKTIKAIRELNKYTSYQYLVRTNNSTWINIPLLNMFLSYQEDDSQIFTGRVYASFWSAFNIYGNGELMIFSNRNVDILNTLAGENSEKFEQTVIGCDDNLLFGLWNKRLAYLKLRESNYLHSLEDAQYIDKDVNVLFDFAQVAHQVKTYGVTDEERMIYDVKKMEDIDALWRSQDLSIEILYELMMNCYYDKYIHVIPYNKSEWNDLVDEQTKKLAKFKNTTKRDEALKWLRVRQKECGYQITKI